ncbi:MAG: lipid-A-disaccharide synthase N-terminal domain-containing protein [Planctomycetota bacterium]
MVDTVAEAIRTAVADQLIGDPVWAIVGLVGQFIFGARFIIQWIVSEYKKKSHIPTTFWFISLAGSLILLAYSVHLRNPIFVLGFSLNTVIYIRNIHLIFRYSKTGEVRPIKNKED